MSQLRAAKRVCKNPGTEAYYLTKSCNDVARRDWLYRDGAARKVLGDRDFVFGGELTRDNLLKIAVTADELREVNVYKVCVQPLDGDEFTVHVDVAAWRISDLKSQIRAKNGMCTCKLHITKSSMELDNRRFVLKASAKMKNGSKLEVWSEPLRVMRYRLVIEEGGILEHDEAETRKMKDAAAARVTVSVLQFRGRSDRAERPRSHAGSGKTYTMGCLLYTSPSPRDATLSRMPSSA